MHGQPHIRFTTQYSLFMKTTGITNPTTTQVRFSAPKCTSLVLQFMV